MKHSIRIGHGEKKGIKISDGFFGEGSRITTSANRCVLFNVLRNKLYIDINGLDCADFCAGSGIIGFEFMSLGAKSCIFVESDRKKIKNIDFAIEKNKFNCRCIYSYLPNLNIDKKFDIIFFDPPYDNDFLHSTLNMIVEADLLNTNGLLIIETKDMLFDININYFKLVDKKNLKNGAFFYFLKKI